MTKKKPADTRRWAAERNCLADGVPVITVALTGVSKCLADSGEAWLAFPCIARGSIAELAARIRALADEVDSMRGMEGGMWSMPWEEKAK